MDTREVRSARPRPGRPGAWRAAAAGRSAFTAAAHRWPEAVVGYHGALELMGSAASAWHVLHVFTHDGRGRLWADGTAVRAVRDPWAGSGGPDGLGGPGVRAVRLAGAAVRHTGPERTLVDGLERPGRCGGAFELAESRWTYPALAWDELLAVVHARVHGRATSPKGWTLAARVGWWLAHFAADYGTPETVTRALAAAAGARRGGGRALDPGAARLGADQTFDPTWALWVPTALLPEAAPAEVEA